MRDIEKQPGHHIAKVVAPVASPRYRRRSVDAGTQYLLMWQLPWPQMRQVRAEIDRSLIVVPRHVPDAIDHAAPRIDRGRASMPTARTVGSRVK